MRILYFTRGYTPHDHRFVAALVEAGHEVLYMRLEGSQRAQEARPLPPAVREIQWRHARGEVHGWELPRLLLSVRQVLSDCCPDLVHAGPVQGSAFLAALAGFHPLVSMSWGSDLLVGARRGAGRRIARYVMARSDVLICDCQTVRRVAEALGMPADRIVVFPWGVDLRHFRPGSDPGMRARLEWGDAFILLSTRSWEPIYGVDVLLAGFIDAVQSAADLRLLILGDGSLRPRLEAMCRRAGIGEQVHFAGQVAYAELPGYYRAANLYVSAAHSDGSSVSLLEALASGLPAIVSDIPGNREWVEPGVNGWWFPDGDAAGLTEAILAARADRSVLPKAAASARAIAEARADWSANVKQLSRAYALARASRCQSPEVM